MINLPNMAQDITFKEEGHVYHMGAIVIPSITQIMKPIYNFNGINANVLQYAADRGTEVHFSIEKFLKYNYISKLDSDAQPYFEQFLNWFNDNHYFREDFLCEIPGYNKTYNICGTLDIIRQDDEGYHLIDIKTGSVADIDVWSVQAAGYELICKGHDIKLRSKTVLQLSPDGYKVYQCSEQSGIFLMCLGIYNFNKNKK